MSEIHPKLILNLNVMSSFHMNCFLVCPIMLKFCTEHGSDTAMFCAKFQNDWTTEMDDMEKRHFVRYECQWIWDEF